MPDPVERAQCSRSSDRRLYARHRVLLSCLKLESDNGGVVLDISEQGLAMQAAKALSEESYAQLRFQLSQSEEWVEARGRIAWISASKQTAGVEFVDLSYKGLVSIKNWISSIALSSEGEKERPEPENAGLPQLGIDEATDIKSVPKPELTRSIDELVECLITEELSGIARREVVGDSRVVVSMARKAPRRPAPESASPSRESSPFAPAQQSRPAAAPRIGPLLDAGSKPQHHVGLLVAAVLVLSTLIALDYIPRKGPDGSVAGASAPSENPPNLPSLNGSLSWRTSPHPDEAPSYGSGFILQVAAINSESGALSLADLLRQKNFPVFVVKPAAQHLYRVLVGPYNDVESAESGQAELKKQGFTAIRKRNSVAR